MQDKLSVKRRDVLKAGSVLGLGAGLGTNMSLLLPSPKTLPELHYTKIIGTCKNDIYIYPEYACYLTKSELMTCLQQMAVDCKNGTLTQQYYKKWVNGVFEDLAIANKDTGIIDVLVQHGANIQELGAKLFADIFHVETNQHFI